MKGLMKLVSMVLVLTVAGMGITLLAVGYAQAKEDCGVFLSTNCYTEGVCQSFGPMHLLACCGGWCTNYDGDDPIFECNGRCSLTGAPCDCTQIGCHTFCGWFPGP